MRASLYRQGDLRRCVKNGGQRCIVVLYFSCQYLRRFWTTLIRLKKLERIIIKTTTYQPSDAPHILLTSLGMRALKTTYMWNEKTVTTKLTPLALVELLEESQLPNHVVAVATQGAKRETWQLFRSGICKTLKISPELVEIPNGNDPDKIRQILESVANRIPKGAELTLDVTQGFRHFPFIFYALVLYLTSFRGVKIRAAYYGMIEGTPKRCSEAHY